MSNRGFRMICMVFVVRVLPVKTCETATARVAIVTNLLFILMRSIVIILPIGNIPFVQCFFPASANNGAILISSKIIEKQRHRRCLCDLRDK